MRRVLPNFESMTEFVGGFTGDCGPDATLFALHAMDPNRYPLTPAALTLLDDQEIARGYAAANGAQNVPSMDAYLTALGAPHVTRGYNQFQFAELHTDLQQLAGIHPIIIEFSQTGDGLPQDEQLVKLHYATVGGIDSDSVVPGTQVTGGYLRADGDANTNQGQSPSPAILTSWQQIVAAVPIAYIVVTGAPSPAARAGAGPVVPAGWTDDGVTLTAPNGVGVTLGFRDSVLAGWAADNWPLRVAEHRDPLEAGNPALGAGNRQVFRRGALGYTAARGVYAIWDGQELLAVEAELTKIQADMAADQQTIAQLQASENTLQQAVSAAATEEASDPAEGGAEPVGTVRLHVVQGSETLLSVSTLYYSDASHADAIQAANHLPTENLSSGMALIIP